MKKSDNIRELEYLASSQWGLFTTAQASRIGVGRTQIARMATYGTVEPIRRGTYHYTAGEETSHLYAKAAWLSCYPKLTAAERLRAHPRDAVLACATAASLHGIGDFHEEPYSFILRKRRQTSMNDLSLHLWKLEERDVTYVDGLPVTTPERTIADLVRERHDPNHIKQVVQGAYAKEVDSCRLMELLNELGPTYNGTVDFLVPLISELAATQEIVADVKAALEGKKSFEDRESSPLEEAFASIVRERLRPILEARAAEIAAQRQSTTAQTPNGGTRITIKRRS